MVCVCVRVALTWQWNKFHSKPICYRHHMCATNITFEYSWLIGFTWFNSFSPYSRHRGLPVPVHRPNFSLFPANRRQLRQCEYWHFWRYFTNNNTKVCFPTKWDIIESVYCLAVVVLFIQLNAYSFKMSQWIKVLIVWLKFVDQLIGGRNAQTIYINLVLTFCVLGHRFHCFHSTTVVQWICASICTMYTLGGPNSNRFPEFR